MDITLISDTHGKHQEITEDLKGGDLLIHCGDSMNSGRNEQELISFCEWFNNLDNYKCKIFIAGNHCRIFETNPKRALQIVENYKNIIYLQDDFYIFEGVKIYGSPWQPEFCSWAFNLPRKGVELQKIWNKIPNDTDILITHCPPYNILDNVRNGEPLGCELLRNKVNELQPKIHCWGHIHDSYGYVYNNDTHNFNASILNERYEYVNKPHTFEWFKDFNNIIL